MKKIIFFIMLLIPLNVFAYVGPLDDEFFTINNQTTSPFNISISGNSSTDVTFKLDYFYNHNLSNYDIPGSYLFVSIESNKKLNINRKYSFGSNCSTSCFSNDDYLQLTNDENGYSYVYYFNIVKWARTVGTQIDQFSVVDIFTFHNLESGTATVYIYGSYANNTNEIPQYINNANTTQQVIIDGQTNTNMIIESNKVCINIDSTSSSNHGYLGSNGAFNSNPSISGVVTDFYAINNQSSILVLRNNNSTHRTCFYNEYKQMISCLGANELTNNTYLNIPSNSKYVRFTIDSSVDRPQFQLCGNGNQIISEQIDETNNSINNINDNITDSSIDNPNSDFSDMEDMIAHNGVITNLIALPITLYSSILNGLNQSCSEYNFGNLFGTDLKFQCINIGALLGNTIWGVIDVLFSGFTIYAIAKKMIKVFNNFSGLQEGDVIDD